MKRRLKFGGKPRPWTGSRPAIYFYDIEGALVAAESCTCLVWGTWGE